MLRKKLDNKISKADNFVCIKKTNKNKRGLIQIPFAWLFAIIVGGIILFLAIYASVKLIKTEEVVSTTETAREISVLMNPLETSFGEERTTLLTLPVESQIINDCESSGTFGQQKIRVSQKIRGQWTDTGIGSVSQNKYIFSGKIVQGKNLYVFSKPFEFPFKVADLIFLTSSQENYCFVDAPEEIQEELVALGQPNLFTENCPSNSIKVCFESDTGENCKVDVDLNDKSVNKNGELVYFEEDALMYAAVFSEKEVYECQVQRLMKRVNQLALIYNEKQNIISGKGCPLEVDTLPLAGSASSYEDSSDLFLVKVIANEVGDDNEKAYCELW